MMYAQILSGQSLLHSASNIVEIGTELAVSFFQYSRNRDGACCIVLPNDTEAPSLLRPIIHSFCGR